MDPVVETSSTGTLPDAATRVTLPPYGSVAASTRETRLNGARQAGFTPEIVTGGAETEQQLPLSEGAYLINLTTRGKTSAGSADGRRAVEVRANGLVPCPDQVNVVRGAQDGEQFILVIPRVRLESHLADLIGHAVDEPIDFDRGFDPTTPRGRSLVAGVAFLARELDRPGGIAEIPLAREELETFVMTEVLLGIRNSYTESMTGLSQRSRTARIEPVLDYMKRHVEQPITPQLLARVGCMSVRTLHVTFQQELGISPMAYLRRIRLDQVRAELLRCVGRDVRISDIAMRWRFFHPSRFARQYCEQFGELPSATLRDTRWPALRTLAESRRPTLRPGDRALRGAARGSDSREQD